MHFSPTVLMHTKACILNFYGNAIGAVPWEIASAVLGSAAEREESKSVSLWLF